MSKILVTGSSSGLGAELLKCLSGAGHSVIPYSLHEGRDVRSPSLSGLEDQLAGGLDVLINCAGVNDIEWLENVSDAQWDEIVDTNLKGIFKMTQALVHHLRERKGTVVNIVSNAAHVPMRCSAAYNASKGGALILTKQLARELAPDITVFSVSPNKLRDTGMSRYIDSRVMATRQWSEEKAKQYQLASLLTGEETPPHAVADFLAFLLSSKTRHKYLAGCDIPYGA
jgi:NAD(P)-dependent dehydrogenase (short-subunit alcohol dehydrogenase family)